MDVISEFFTTLAAAPRSGLMLDYDGTLAPFQAKRDQAVPYPGVRELLSAIQACRRTRLVIVSGRPVHEVLALLEMQDAPEVWGVHGWERLRPPGRTLTISPPVAARDALAAARAALESAGYAAHAEIKSASVAVHWRGLSSTLGRDIRNRMRRHWQPLAERGPLQLLDFAAGLELRAIGRDKGYAVRTIASELGNRAATAFLGDDVTDEDGFEAIADLGLGILVSERPRATAAAAQLCPPDELMEFLRRWRDTVEEAAS